MSSILLSLFGAASQGLTWAILALGVYITFRILDIPDMTCEGSFALGGSVCSILIVRFQWDPLIALMCATVAGMAAGFITGFLHTKLKIPAILAGILTMVGLYSINLRVMGQANTALLGQQTLVSRVQGILPSAESLGIKNSVLQTTSVMTVGLIFTAIVVCFLYWFFGTEIGSCIRATGNNPAMVRAQGVNTDSMKIFGLILGNALVALSGALVTQSQSYADVGMGIGAIVIGLASIVIGEVIFAKVKNFARKLLAVAFGSVLYRIIIAFVLQLGLNANDLKLLTSIVVAIALSIPVLRHTKVFVAIHSFFVKLRGAGKNQSRKESR